MGVKRRPPTNNKLELSTQTYIHHPKCLDTHRFSAMLLPTRFIAIYPAFLSTRLLLAIDMTIYIIGQTIWDLGFTTTDYWALDSPHWIESSLRGNSLFSDPLVKYDLFDPYAKTTSHSSMKSSSYRSEEVMSSANGGVPHRTAYTESSSRTTNIGNSGIPHSSYSHSTSSYDSDRPYGNRVSSYSYHI